MYPARIHAIPELLAQCSRLSVRCGVWDVRVVKEVMEAVSTLTCTTCAALTSPSCLIPIASAWIFNIAHQSDEFNFSFTSLKPYCHVNSNPEPRTPNPEPRTSNLEAAKAKAILGVYDNA